MLTNLEFLEEPPILVARFSGKAEVAFIEKSVDLVIQESERTKLTLVLADFTGLQWSGYSLVERYRVSLTATKAVGKIEKVANVAAKDIVDPQLFGEMVARNRGLNLRVFTSEAEARAWLLEK